MTDSVSQFDQMLLQFADSASAVSIPINEQFLRLRISADTPALLPIQQIAEVLTIPESQIMPIPHLSAWVMGVYNWRGEILWMIDLGHLCGLPPWYQRPLYRSAHTAVILNLLGSATPTSRLTKGQLLGLVVQQVEEIEQYSSDQMQSLPPVAVAPKLAQMAAGYRQDSDQIAVPILDGAALLSAIL